MREDGYTLTELLVVLAIMGLIAAAALPSMFSAQPGFESKAVARAMADDFAAARQLAVATNNETRIVFRPDRYRTLPQGPARLLPTAVSLRAAQGEIDFFPDGSSSGGIVIVQSARARHRVVAHWPSGRITVDE